MKLACMVLVLGCPPLAAFASMDDAAVGREKKSGIITATTTMNKNRRSMRDVPPEEKASQKEVAAAATRVLATCSDDDEFTVTDYFDTTRDGCYSVFDDDEASRSIPWYTLDGEGGDGIVFSATFGVSNSSDVLFWGIFDGNPDEDTGFFGNSLVCYDTDENKVLEFHPSEVTSWTCSFNGTSSSTTDAVPFSIACGCDGVNSTSSAPTSVVGRAKVTSSLILPLVVLKLLSCIF